MIAVLAFGLLFVLDYYFDAEVNIKTRDEVKREQLVDSGYLENEANLNEAMAVLIRYKTLYGSDLDTMIARARIYDKLKQTAKAVAEYKAILYSGYGLDPDLVKYIKGRIAVGAK